MVVKVGFYTDKKNESFIRSGTRCVFFSENLESLAFTAWAKSTELQQFETGPGMTFV